MEARVTVATPRHQQAPEVVARRIELALAMLERGASVFPLAHNAKIPFLSKRKGGEGFLDAKPDPELARTFLGNPGQLNYGVVFPEGSDVIVLDIDGGDRSSRPDWREEWQALYDRHGPPGLTFIVKTPSGGQHAYYRWREDLYGPVPPGDEMLGWTVRKPWKGYLVGPGSVVNGLVYEPSGIETIADLPEAWARAALAETKPRRAPATTGPVISIKGPGQVQAGHRHAYLRDQARHLVGIGLTGDALVTAVMALNAQLPEPKTADEVLRAIGDAETKFEPDELDPVTGKATTSGDPFEDHPLTQFESQSIEWLWEAWLPRGVVTIMDGNPGVSKSTLLADLAARISTGRPWPDESPMPDGSRRVIWITTEDDPGRVLRPRVEAAGGDASLVRFVTSEVVFPSGAKRFRELLVRRAREPEGLALVMVDPLFSHIEATVRTIADAEMRKGVMTPLGDAAEAAGCAVLVVRHNSKDTAASAINRGAGSLGGLVGAARAVWSVAVDPSDESGETKAIGVSKLNYARTRPSLLYRVVDRLPPGWVTGSVAGVEWIGESSIPIATLMAEKPGVSDAVAYLEELLTDGPMAAAKVDTMMRSRGFGPSTVKGASARLRVVKRKTGMTGGWEWSLPVIFEDDTDAFEDDGVALEGDDASSSSLARGRGREDPDSSSSSKKSTSSKASKVGAPPAGAGAREAEVAPVVVETDTAATWAKACAMYEYHRSAHRWTPEGWVCDLCFPPEGAS